VTAPARDLFTIGQLAAGIAHEINTPMQYIGDNVTFLDGTLTDVFALIQAYRGIVDVLKSDPSRADLVERANAAEELADMSYLASGVPRAILATLEGIGRVRKIVSAMKDFSHPGGAGKELSDLHRGIESTVTISASVAAVMTEIRGRTDAGNELSTAPGSTPAPSTVKVSAG
jgi:signal transduction histidine kinase